MRTISSSFKYIFNRGNYKGKEYFCNISVPCSNPFCDCTEIEIVTGDRENRDECSERYSFTLDFRLKKVAKKSSENETNSFARDFAADLLDEDWSFFEDFFRSSKVEMTNEAHGKDMDFDFAKLDEEIREGMMISYGEVVPFHEQFQFSSGDAKYVVIDDYCLRPACNCRDASLSFYEVVGDKITRKSKSFRFMYNYIKKTWHSESSRNDLMRSLVEEYPDLKSTVRKRHRQLKQMYKSYCEKKGFSESPAISSKTTGRNDPCPCGSGKKYKKCCGL